MPSDAVLRRLEDIADNIERIERYTRGYDASGFAEDGMCRDAVQHCLLRISEAARGLGVDAERLAPQIPWRDIRGIGNHLRHEYQRVDVGLIWRIVEKDLAPLKASTVAALALLRG